jgi:hypothetical protein
MNAVLTGPVTAIHACTTNGAKQLVVASNGEIHILENDSTKPNFGDVIQTLAKPTGEPFAKGKNYTQCNAAYSVANNRTMIPSGTSSEDFTDVCRAGHSSFQSFQL